MLCLGRKVGEEILIGPDIRVIVYEVHGKYVKLAIDAPADTKILRGELVGRRSLPEDAIPVLIKSPPRSGGCFDSEAVQMSEWRLHGGPHPLGWDDNRDNTPAPKGSSDGMQ